MADAEETEMPATSMKPDKEWSTREKLAIASYVLRSGEQNWSGAGRFLRPLGEPGRPADWFSPKFCAQQYTALMDQLEAPKRKRSERSESSENIQPSSSPEEVIIARLTKERIEELKKQVRCERTEYRKLKRDIELLESGALDDQLNDLIDEIEHGETKGSEPKAEFTEKEEEIKPESVVPVCNLQPPVEQLPPVSQVESNTAEHDQPLEKPPQSSMETETLPKEGLVEVSEMSSENDEKMDTAPSGPEENLDESFEKTAPEVAEESAPPVVVDNPQDEQKEPDIVKQDVAPDNFLEQEDLQANAITEAEDEVGKDAEEVCEMPKNEEDEMEITELEELPKEDKTEKPEITPVLEADTSSNISVDEEAKQSISLPGTPVPSGSFPFDSFPSSPALSHSSDMDPDATASWKAWKKSIMILWKQIASHRLANIFLTPVTDEIAPNYSTTVYRKMDLIMIKKNIESGVTRTTIQFQRDIMLMFQNAVMYNNVEHDVYKMATEMQKDVVDQIAQYLATQMIVEAATSALPTENKSLRRSTIRRSALSDKVGQTRSRRSAVAAEGETKSTR